MRIFRTPAPVLAILSILFLLASCGGESPPEEQAPAVDQTPADSSAAVLEEPGETETPPAPETESDQPDHAGPQGTWDTTMGVMELVLTDSGTVTGTYPLGTIQGTIDGHTLEYSYNEGSLTGEGVFEFDTDFGSFSGVQDIAGTELVWEGQRI